MLNDVKERIYEYDNYRFFLRDYFREQKRLRATFSHRFFARRAGFSSSSFCAHVIEGKRNLTTKSLRQMNRGLGLGGRAAKYFETLVFYNQSKTIEERESFARVLQRIRKAANFYKVNQRQYAYYDQWYHPIIRELAVFSDWNGDFARLGAMVRPSISADKAKKAVETLVSVGLLVVDENGEYRQVSEALTAEGVPPVVTRAFRREYLHLAGHAMEELEIKDRHVSGVTVAMSRARFDHLCARLDDIRREVLENAIDDTHVDGVYQFNFQAFPMTNEGIVRNREPEGSDQK